MKNKLLPLLAILLAVVGIIWFGQGIGLIHGSVMTDDSKWAIIGGIMIALAVVLFVLSRRGRN